MRMYFVQYICIRIVLQYFETLTMKLEGTNKQLTTIKIVYPQFHYNRFNGLISTPKIYQDNCEHKVKEEILFLVLVQF